MYASRDIFKTTTDLYQQIIHETLDRAQCPDPTYPNRRVEFEKKILQKLMDKNIINKIQLQTLDSMYPSFPSEYYQATGYHKIISQPNVIHTPYSQQMFNPSYPLTQQHFQQPYRQQPNFPEQPQPSFSSLQTSSIPYHANDTIINSAQNFKMFNQQPIRSMQGNTSFNNGTFSGFPQPAEFKLTSELQSEHMTQNAPVTQNFEDTESESDWSDVELGADDKKQNSNVEKTDQLLENMNSNELQSSDEDIDVDDLIRNSSDKRNCLFGVDTSLSAKRPRKNRGNWTIELTNAFIRLEDGREAFLNHVKGDLKCNFY
eukprot:TRINITY_DN2348_c0_g2_i1.p1 TRINITY_DN2348_c0_g2~~TRINITY_DN2348_c0_g2_i1.p1  ORF type:complete len:316 (+),score=73.86 TRINITY_DN2348_c0_g2_i1:39-986(+)